MQMQRVLPDKSSGIVSNERGLPRGIPPTIATKMRFGNETWGPNNDKPALLGLAYFSSEMTRKLQISAQSALSSIQAAGNSSSWLGKNMAAGRGLTFVT